MTPSPNDQDEAPVSAPIISSLQRQGFGITRAQRPRGTDDWLLVGTLEGTGFVRTSGGTVRLLRRGDMLLFPPHTFQDYGHFDDDSAWVNVWVHFRPRAHWLGWLAWPTLADGVGAVAVDSGFEEIEAELRRLVEVAHGPSRLRVEASMNSLERVLLLVDEANPRFAAPSLDQRIRKALEIVGERVSEPIDVGWLCRAVGLSRSQFTTLFTRQMKASPQAYIENVKLMRAAQMLQSPSWTVSQVAAETGFASPFYFSTRFRRQFGLSPTEYRQRHVQRCENIFEPSRR